MSETDRKPMRIRRVVNDGDQMFITPQAAAQDRALTFEARGVLWYLLSKPADWDVSPRDLEQNCGRDRAYRMINELIEHGYIHRTVNRDAFGKVASVDYDVYSRPILPFTEKPETAQPDTANTDNTEERVLQNRDSRRKKSAGRKPSKITNPDYKSIYDHVGFAYYQVNPHDTEAFKPYGSGTGSIVKALLEAAPNITADQTWRFLQKLEREESEFRKYSRGGRLQEQVADFMRAEAKRNAPKPEPAPAPEVPNDISLPVVYQPRIIVA